jgi:hypothetical protein
MRTLLVMLSIASLATLVGCAQIDRFSPSATERTEATLKPSVGERTTATLGDTLIVQGRTVYAPSIRLKESYETEWIRNSGGRAFPFVFEQGAVLREVGQYKGIPIYIGPAKGGLVGSDGKQFGAYGLGVRSDGQVDYVHLSGSIIPETPNRRAQVENIQVVYETKETFQQQFIYSGRNADSLFFTYREFSGDLARPAFTQNVTYSVRDGTTVGFKNLRIEVINASNVTIDYRVLSPF